MKSPFPGMDPYLERLWPYVHHALVSFAAQQLNDKLPEDLVATDESRVAVGAISLRRPVPPLGIPLRKDDPTVRLDLQPLIEATYVTRRYARRIDYSKPLEPPLPEEDAKWACDLLDRAKGK
jgi:hypothetical protein